MLGWEKLTSKYFSVSLVNICDSLFNKQFLPVKTTMHLLVSKDDGLFCHSLGKSKQLFDCRLASK